MKDVLADMRLQRDKNRVLWDHTEKVHQESLVLRQSQSKAMHEHDWSRARVWIPARRHTEYVTAWNQQLQMDQERELHVLNAMVGTELAVPAAPHTPSHEEVDDGDKRIPRERSPYDAHRVKRE